MKLKTSYILILLIIVAAALRIWAATEGEIEADSAISIIKTSGNYRSYRQVLPDTIASSGYLKSLILPPGILPLEVLIADRPGGSHPPLYFFALHYWINLLEFSVFKASLLSVIFGVLAIPMFYLVCAQIIPRRDALFAASFMTFSGLFIWVSQYIRQYSLLLFLGLAYLFFTLRLTRAEGRRWPNYLLLIVAGIASAYCHLIFWFILIAANIFYLSRFRLKKKVIVNWLACQAVILLAALPALLDYFAETPGVSGEAAGEALGVVTILKAIGYMISGFFYRYQYGYYTRVDQILGRIFLVLIAILIAVAVKNRKQAGNLSLIGALLGVTFVLQIGMVYFMQREIMLRLLYYYLFGAAALFALVAFGLGRLKAAWLRWPLFALLIVGTNISWRWWPYESPRKFSTIADYIMERYEPGDVIIIDNPKWSLVGPMFIYFGRQDVDILCLHRDKLMPMLEERRPEELFERNNIFYFQNLIRMSRDPEELAYLNELFERDYELIRENRFRHFTTVFEYTKR